MKAFIRLIRHHSAVLAVGGRHHGDVCLRRPAGKGFEPHDAAVAVNITVVDATNNGEMTAYPASESRPLASAISYNVNLARANNGILKLGNGALAFYNNQPSGSAHLIIDVNGYFTEGGGAVVAYHAYYPFGEEATAFNQDAEQMKFTGHERDLGSLVGAGDDLDYMHARFCSPFTGRFLSPDPDDSAKRSQPQSWNQYAYALNNPLRYVDPDGRTEREGATAGVIVNRSSEIIWIAGDIGGKTYVIPLGPGESSATYFVDADAIVIDPGEVTSKGALLAPSIEGETSGAIKIGVSSVEVEDSGPMNLGLDRSAGYGVSRLVGKAGFLDVHEAEREEWVMPGDRQGAEKTKQELQRLMEERKKEAEKKKDAEKKKQEETPAAPRQ